MGSDVCKADYWRPRPLIALNRLFYSPIRPSAPFNSLLDYAVNKVLRSMDMNRDQAVLSGAKLWLIVGIAAGVAVVSYFMAGSSPDEPKPAQPVETPAIESELPALPESESETETETEPLVLPPAPEPEAPKRQPEVVVKLPPEKPPEPVVPGLPLLEGSDPEVYRELAGTVRNADAADLKGVIAPKDRIRRFVTTVKNVGEHKIARRHLPVRAAKGAFAVKRIPDGRLVIDKANYRRYTPYVELLEAVDAQKLAAVYKRLSPLFDQAYQELGYPRGKFERPLLAAIDHVLAAPDRSGELVVKRQSVNYVFADQALESLPEIDKLMLRMGPDNARRVKARLRVLRAELIR